MITILTTWHTSLLQQQEKATVLNGNPTFDLIDLSAPIFQFHYEVYPCHE